MSLSQGPTLTSKAMKHKRILPPLIDLGAFLTKWQLFNHSLASVCRTLVVLKAFPWTGILHIATDYLKAPKEELRLESWVWKLWNQPRDILPTSHLSMDIWGWQTNREEKKQYKKPTHLDLILNQNSNKQNPNQNKQTTDKATAAHMWAHIIRKYHSQGCYPLFFFSRWLPCFYSSSLFSAYVWLWTSRLIIVNFRLANQFIQWPVNFQALEEEGGVGKLDSCFHSQISLIFALKLLCFHNKPIVPMHLYIPLNKLFFKDMNNWMSEIL